MTDSAPTDPVFPSQSSRTAETPDKSVTVPRGEEAARLSPDVSDISEDEVALILAMQGGFEPRADDPLVRALEARGLASEASGHAWSLTESGVAYRPA
jgi:hypothetical protein